MDQLMDELVISFENSCAVLFPVVLFEKIRMDQETSSFDVVWKYL